VIGKNARSLSEYFSVVRGIRKNWRVPEKNELWFRAEDSNHRRTFLQPGLYRPRKAGLRKSVQDLLDLENDLYAEFGRCATQLSDLTFTDEEWAWDTYFLMQHHGVPTRILDWTDGALIALHFAVKNKPIPLKSGSIIYAFDPYWLIELLEKHSDRRNSKRRWKRYCSKRPWDRDEDEWDDLYLPLDKEDKSDPLLRVPLTPILWDSPHLARRVAAQRSRFMIFGSDPLWLSAMSKLARSKMVSITIPTNAINGIRNELRDAGVTESVVFPDLDGLGRELRQVWDARR